VVERVKRAGEYAAVGDVVARLAGNGGLEIHLFMPLRHVRVIVPGSEVAVHLEGAESRAPVKSVVPVGDARSQSFEIVLDAQRIEHGAHGPTHHRLAEIELTERAALRDEHQEGDLIGHGERGERVRQGGKAARLHQKRATHAAHPGAGKDAERLLLAGGGEGGEVIVRVK